MTMPSSVPKTARRPFRAAVVALLTVVIVAVFATAASAHTSNVAHKETCNDDGATMTVVTFDNDYNLPAVVTYHWGSDAASTAPIGPKSGSENGTASLPKHAVGTLSYHVTWSDDYRQPPDHGESTLTVAPLPDCHETATTVPSTTTTTAPATTTTTRAATTTTTLAATTTTTAPAAIAAVTTTSGPATTVLGETLTQPAATPAATLPRTGSSTGTIVTLAAIILALGVMARRIGRTKTGARS